MSETLNFHFIAIGGIGMSGLAKYLIEMGHNVSGSDLEETKYTQKVQKLGAKVYIGHKEEQVPDNSIVVASTAIRETNPEIVQASVNYMDSLQRVWIANSEGLFTSDTRVYTRFSCSAIASNGTENQTGTCSPGAMQGFEIFDSRIDPQAVAREAAQQDQSQQDHAEGHGTQKFH
jgi:predicted Zn-dependent protease